MKYAVAYMNFLDNDLQLISVEADNPITAMVEGARKLINSDPDTDEWLNGFLKPVSPAWYAARIVEIQEEFYNTGQLTAVMPID